MLWCFLSRGVTRGGYFEGARVALQNPTAHKQTPAHPRREVAGMSIERCAKHSRHYDTDAIERCPLCVEECVMRRNRIDLYTPAEKAIHDAIQAVEAVGAHPYLTAAVVLLQEAKENVADYVDEIIKE